MGFLVKASLRKWWKFWVLVGTRAPRPQTQVSPHVGHPASSRGGSLLQEEARLRPRAAVLGNPAVVTRQLLAPPSLTICPSSLPTRVPGPRAGAGPSHRWSTKAESAGLLRLHPGSWLKVLRPRGDCWKGGPSRACGPSPASLVSQPGRLEATLRHKHQGPVESTEVRGQGQQGPRGQARGQVSVQRTSWGADGIEGAAARPARWL